MNHAWKRSPHWPRHLPEAVDVPETNLWSNLEIAALRFPGKCAYAFQGRGVSFRQFLAEASTLAGWLAGQGIEAGERVALLLPNCPEFPVAFHAVMRLGGVVVPLNPMYKAAELAHVLRDSGARLVICWGDLLPELRAAVDALEPASRPRLLATSDGASPAPVGADVVDWPTAMATAQVPPSVGVLPDAVALLAYTSGTTGLPKGCIHTHRTLMHSAIAFALVQEITTEARALTAVPLFHITGLVTGVLSNVYFAHTIVLMQRWNAEQAARLIREQRITHFCCIPTMIVDLLASPKVDEFDLSSLHNLCGGGAAMPQAVADRLKARFGLDFVEGYGLTETAAMTHMNPVRRAKQQCLGLPAFGNRALVVDPDSGRELPPGAQGEIVIAGASVFRGYWNRPEATAAAFLQVDGTAFFRTGDLGHADEEGYFFLTDRLKRMINASGFKVWPAEVESILYRHPVVREACVVAAHDEYRGETVKAYIVARPEAKAVPTADDIQQWARTHMAAYKVPRRVEFVDALPKSASGKILWRVLQECELR